MKLASFSHKEGETKYTFKKWTKCSQKEGQESWSKSQVICMAAPKTPF